MTSHIKYIIITAIFIFARLQPILADNNVFSGQILRNDERIAIHSSNEMGHATFGTTINIDGVRLYNNASTSETKGAGLRNMSSSNIESIEIITGIPSVEYGDFSNGLIKINTKKGKTPWMVEFNTESKTKQIALNKEFRLSKKGGTLNTSLERAKSNSSIATPYTTYERNVVSLNYANTLNSSNKRPLNIAADCSGNIEGYNSKADPDAVSNTYTKQIYYSLRGHVHLNWLINLPWLTNVSLSSSINYSDRLRKTNAYKSSASTML